MFRSGKKDKAAKEKVKKDKANHSELQKISSEMPVEIVPETPASICCEAVRKNDLDLLKEYIEKEKIDCIATRSKEGESLLHLAETSYHAKVFEYILSKFKAAKQVDVRNAEGYTPLHRAVINLNPNAVEQLLAAGANPNLRTEEIKSSCYTIPSLLLLLYKRNRDNEIRRQICRQLLKSGFDLNLTAVVSTRKEDKSVPILQAVLFANDGVLANVIQEHLDLNKVQQQNQNANLEARIAQLEAEVSRLKVAISQQAPEQEKPLASSRFFS